MAVGVGHQLIALFAGCIEAEGVINVLVDRKRHGGVGTINAGAAGINQMLNTMVTAPFEDVSKANDVAVDVSKWVVDGITHTSLGRQIDHPLWLVCGETVFNGWAICQVNSQMRVVGMVIKTRQTGLFDGRVVIVIVVVNTNDHVAALE